MVQNQDWPVHELAAQFLCDSVYEMSIAELWCFFFFWRLTICENFPALDITCVLRAPEISACSRSMTSNWLLDINSGLQIYFLKSVVGDKTAHSKIHLFFTKMNQCWQCSAKHCQSYSTAKSKVISSVISNRWLKCLLGAHWLLPFTYPIMWAISKCKIMSD